MEQNIVESVVEGKLSELVKFLCLWNEKISNIRDPIKNTLIHIASQNERGEILDHILKYVEIT